MRRRDNERMLHDDNATSTGGVRVLVRIPVTPMRIEARTAPQSRVTPNAEPWRRGDAATRRRLDDDGNEATRRGNDEATRRRVTPALPQMLPQSRVTPNVTRAALPQMLPPMLPQSGVTPNVSPEPR